MDVTVMLQSIRVHQHNSDCTTCGIEVESPKVVYCSPECEEAGWHFVLWGPWPYIVRGED